jgi:NodT family efflux transporter outer membrane factor (OMF) lipoprotein
MTPGKPVPDVLPDYRFGLVSSWEVDLRGRLKNAKRAAVERFLSSTEGKNLIMSDLVAEVAATYYELQALDRRLAILQDAIRLQTQALEAVRVQKAAARATELAVQQFEAQVMDTRTEEADCRQQIALAENHMNLLLGRYPQAVPRSADAFMSRELPMIRAGIPSQLLINRPDIRQAEHDLQAARFDVRVARAEFYPEINITSGLGYQAFNTRYLLRSPESLAFSLAGDALAPLINRSAIRAEFNKASALQVRALVNYERTLLTGFAEVSNELLSLDKLQEINRLRSEQVEVLRKATETSYELFKAARADYLEVLTVQRDVLEKQLEQVENRKDLLTTGIRLYKALGGGWR